MQTTLAYVRTVRISAYTNHSFLLKPSILMSITIRHSINWYSGGMSFPSFIILIATWCSSPLEQWHPIKGYCHSTCQTQEHALLTLLSLCQTYGYACGTFFHYSNNPISFLQDIRWAAFQPKFSHCLLLCSKKTMLHMQTDFLVIG